MTPSMRTFSKVLLAALLLAAMTAARGDGLSTSMSPQTGGGIGGWFDGGLSYQKASGSPPPVCSNSLDFSQSCNSQYIGAL